MPSSKSTWNSRRNSSSLDVLTAPLIITLLPKQEETVTGKDVTLKVVVRESPKLEAQWFYNDTPVAPENITYDEEKSEYQLFSSKKQQLLQQVKEHIE